MVVGKYIKKILAILFSFFCSFSICYFYLDDLVGRFTDQTYIFITMRILLFSLISLYLLGKLDFKKISIIYILLIAVLTFKKVAFRSYNFNVFSIIHELNYNNQKLLLLGNIIMYIPVGYFIMKGQKGFLKNLSLFIVFIFLVESTQYLLMLGIFDINDIILNSLGFMIGMILFKITDRNKVLFKV